MVRNSGKYGKPQRGGGKRFTPARTLRAEAEEKGGMWDKEKGSDDSEEEDDDDDDDEEEESSEESSDEDDAAPRSKVTFAQAGPSTSSSSAAATRAQTSSLPSTTAGPSSSRTNSTGVDKFGNAPELTKREAKKAAQAAKAQAGSDESSSEEDDDPLLNAGKANSSLSKQMKASSLGKSDGTKAPSAAPTGMNRKEREEAAKKAAREKYLELHRAGKTVEAKADLARLAQIRKEREEAAARKAAEKAAQDEAKAKAMAASGRKR